MNVTDIDQPIYFVGILEHRLGWGLTPRAAFRRFWSEAWRLALAAVSVPNTEQTWLERECMRLVSERDSQNWHRALEARGIR